MKKLTSLLILMIFASSVMFAQSTTNNGQMVEKKSYKIEKTDEGTPSVVDFDANAIINPHATYNPVDLFDHQFDFICGDASGEAGVETNGDYIYTSKWNGDGFFCYEMDGTFLGWFPVAGEAAVRDLAYDGTYFYGAAASTSLYEMDFVGMSGTLISTLTAAVATRACAYDAEFDGFWGNNWSDPITLYDRTGGILNQFNCGAYSSYYGFARLNDAGTEYLYGFAQSGGASQSVIVQIDPVTGVETGVTFDAIGYSTTGTGIAGGIAAFDSYAPGWWTLLGIIQNEAIFGVEGGIAGPPPDNDLKLTGIPEPNSGLGLGVENIVIGVKNVGALTQSNIEVQYRVDGGAWVVEVLPNPLAQGESIAYTFNQAYDFSAFGDYFIEAEVILVGDENPDNNSGDKTITNTDPAGICDFSVTMWDDYGDGWNGGILQLFCDGIEVFSGGLASGAGPETYTFMVYDLTFLTAVWTAGGWPYECSYEIYDANGVSIFQDGFGGVDPVGGDVGTVYCDFIPCVVECPTGGYPEGEECAGDEYVDNFNGGCNADPYVYSPIECGDIVCGTSSTYLFEGSNFRDTDWYELIITEQMNITWTIEAEFPALAFIIDGTLGCDNYTILTSNTGDPCTIFETTAQVMPGIYWLWVGPSVFEGYPCDGENNDYYGIVECTPYQPVYCDASTLTEDEWIANVLCGTIDNPSGWQGGVADYTDQFTIISAGVSEPILVTNGNPWASDNVTCWVDWNSDFVWEQLGDEEFVLNNDGTGAFFDGFITPPAGTPMGEYRMRVRMTYSVDPFPCGEASYGEVEDYTIVVGAPVLYDAGVTAILSPVSGEYLGVEPVTVTVKNFGSETLPEIPVGFNLDMAGWVDEVVPGPVGPGEEVEYTFTATVDLTAFGTYALEACTFLPGDENVTNDCAAAIIENTEPMTGCMWSVTMWDDYGDGWNGGLLEIFGDGILLFSGTIETGAGPETYEFNVQGGEALVAVYTAGGWPYENSYIVYDFMGNPVFEDGMGGVEPVGGDIGVAYCELLPDCEWTVDLMDDYGDGWNGGLLEIYAGAELVFSGTLETGAGPETYIFDVYEGILLTAVYTPGSWAYENFYIVYDNYGNVVFEDGLGGVEPIGGIIGTGTCVEPLFPEITVDPASFDVTVDVGGTGQEFLNIGNIGEGVLDYVIGVTYGPTEATLPTNVNAKIDPNAYMTDKDPIANSDWDYDCPAGSVVSQPCPDYSTAMTADEAGYYDFYQSFSGGGDIEGIRFWGIDAIFSGAWTPCAGTEPKTFHIGFYADDAGQPGAMIDEFTIPVPRTNTGDLFASTYTMWEYEVALPNSVTLTDGWFSVMAMIDPAPCWFLALNAPNGAGVGQQWDGTAWNPQDPMGFCLLGEAVIPWLTVNPLSGTVDPQGSDQITLDFNAGDYPLGTVLTANIAIASNDPVTPVVDVPVQMTVGGGCVPHFIFEGGDPSQPVWTIYIGGATVPDTDADMEAGDEIAIFDGDVMVGLFVLDQVCTIDNAFDNDLTAFSNLTSQPGYTAGNAFSFKGWDCSAEVEYDMFLYEFFDPYGDAYMGDVFPTGDGEYSLATIDFVSFVQQTFNLAVGYQFISSGVDPLDPDMMVVMADVLNTNLDFVRNSGGQMLRKIGPVWVNGIGNWIVEEGYLVKMFAADVFTITGAPVAVGTPIDVFTGYQFVSYFPTTAMNAMDAFVTIIGADLDFIRNSAGQMVRKIGPVWVNGIGDAMPGEGYLVKMFADGQIVYPSAAKSSGITSITPSHLLFEGGNAAEPVYTMYIDGLGIGDEVAAYSGDVVIGSMTVTSDNVYSNSLAVFSQVADGQGYVAGEPISLKVWSNDNVVTAEFEMEVVYNSYVSSVYPSNDGEFSVVNVTKGAALGELVVYPNPATNMIFISSPNQINNVVIFNYVGQSVYQGNSSEINTSNFESGVYIIRIETVNGIETQKVTIR
jgi:hypothetical protein